MTKVGAGFTKQRARVPLVNPKDINMNNSIVYDNIEKYEYKNAKNHKIVTPRFDKTYSRGVDNTGLPCFMENIYNRTTLNTIS